MSDQTATQFIMSLSPTIREVLDSYERQITALNKSLGTAIEAHQAALAEIAHLNKQIDMLVEQVNSMVNQLDRAEDDCKVMAEALLDAHANQVNWCGDKGTCDVCTVARRYVNE